MKGLQSSEPLHTKLPPNFCFLRHTVSKETFLPIGWRTFIDEKICQSAALCWFGLRDVGILQIFYSRAILQRTILLTRPHFLPNCHYYLYNRRCFLGQLNGPCSFNCKNRLQRLKVHKHELILNFFLPKSNPYMPF